MYARNFFETAGKDVNKFLLIDRLNLAFKLGPMSHVEFTEFEKTFIRKIEQCQTFDDVVEISIELHGYCKDEFEKKKEQDQKEYQEKLESEEQDRWMIYLDINDCKNPKLEEAAKAAWVGIEFIQGDSRHVEIPECDLLFIDTLHTYGS